MSFHSSEVIDFREMHFHECKMAHRFPPIGGDGMALLVQAEYLRDPHEVLLAEFGACIRNFSFHYADTITRHVQQFIVDNTQSVIGVGDSVHIDPTTFDMVVSGGTVDSDMYYKYCYGIEELYEGLFMFMSGNIELQSRKLFGGVRQFLNPQKAEEKANNWIYQNYLPEVETYMERAYSYGYIADINNPSEDARIILNMASNFHSSVVPNCEQSVEVLWGKANRYIMAPDSFLYDPGLGTVLHKAYEHHGTINGIPLTDLYIPWELFPVESNS